VRRCTPADVTQVLALWHEADATASPTDTVAEVTRAATTDSLCFVVAEAGDRIIGTAMGGFDGWRGNLYRLAVHPDYRRRGAGRALVSAVERYFASAHVRRVSALVERDHPWALAFWSALGYDVDPRMVRCVKAVKPDTRDS
jgi:ribosomal protein S18 acetylase RimI-like enzyme